MWKMLNKINIHYNLCVHVCVTKWNGIEAFKRKREERGGGGQEINEMTREKKRHETRRQGTATLILLRRCKKVP